MEKEEELTQCQITLCQSYFRGSVPVMFFQYKSLCKQQKHLSWP